jgi:tetratricopeptide (TPR) repeat protein
MAKRKVVSTQESVNQDDTLVDLGGVQQQFQTLWNQYGKIVTYVGGGLLALVALYLGYKNFYVAPRQQEALKQMYMAEQKFAVDSFQVALNGTAAAGLDASGFKGFKDIASEYSGTDAANLATYYAGICNLNLGNFDEAVKCLEDYSGSGKLGCVMKHGALGDAFSEKEMFDKAYSQYEKAVKEGDDEVLTPYYMKKLALLSLYEKVNKPAEAKKLFMDIKDKYPRSMEALEADKQIARLTAKGI